MRAFPLLLAIAILCQAVAPQLSSADVKDIDSADALKVSPSVRAELNSIENATAVPGSKEELAQRLDQAAKDLRPLSIFKAKQLPPQSPEDHATNSIVHVPPIRPGELISLAAMKGLELDAPYSVPMTLKAALNQAFYHSLPIKISYDSLGYQQWQLASAIVSALPIPSFSTGYGYTRSKTQPNTVETSEVFPVSLTYSVFQGGSVVYAALAQYYREEGWKQSYRGTVNDALLDVYQKYNNLLLQQAVLRIRIKAVAVSEAQLRLTNAQYLAGTGTTLSIIQARAQLESDKQALIDQEVAVRQASLALNFSINMPEAVNVVPADLTLREARIANADDLIEDWLRTSLVANPSLRQYEMFKLAADRSVSVAVGPLYPRVSFSTLYTSSLVKVNPPGGTVGGVAVAQITSALNGLGTATPNALGQTASFSPTGSTTANTGISNTVATQVVAASGGEPINVVQSGSIVTSGAASPTIISSGGGGSSPNVNGSNAPGQGVFGGATRDTQGVFSLGWTLSNMGLSAAVNTAAAATLAHQAALQSDQELLLVGEQIRADYCTLVSAKTRIDNAALQVASTAESLRITNLRLSVGTGTTVEAIVAQREYVNALITQAVAIITSNIAQARMLHDTGVISIAKLTADSLQ